VDVVKIGLRFDRRQKTAIKKGTLPQSNKGEKVAGFAGTNHFEGRPLCHWDQHIIKENKIKKKEHALGSHQLRGGTATKEGGTLGHKGLQREIMLLSSRIGKKNDMYGQK